MDLLCWDDLDPFGTELNDPLAELEQDLHHRLSEEYGSNPDDLDRGVGIGNRLNGTDSITDVATDIEADFRKDNRVRRCQATITKGDEPGEYLIDIRVEATEGVLALGYTFDGQGNLVRRAG